MFVVLSAGMLTGLSATMIQAAPVYADTKDCKNNDDHNCNTSERDLKTEQENNCKVEDGGGNANGGDAKDDSGDGGDGGSGSGNDNAFTCINDVIQPNTGNNAHDEDNVSNEPGDVLICHRPNGNPSQSQTLSLSQNAADSHLANHPFDTLGACPPST